MTGTRIIALQSVTRLRIPLISCRTVVVFLFVKIAIFVPSSRMSLEGSMMKRAETIDPQHMSDRKTA